MHLIPESVTLVVAGTWNPAILNPGWIAQHILDVPLGQEIPAQIGVTYPGGQPPLITLRQIVFMPGRDRLVLQTTSLSRGALRRVQTAAARILRLLPHTPLRAFGHNFEFVEEDPTAEQIAVFSAVTDLPQFLDFEFETVATRIASTIRFDERLLNLTRSSESGRLKLAFNFHYEPSSTEQAAEKLENAALFVENLAYARRIIRRVYDIEIPDLPEEGPETATNPAQPIAANQP